MADPAPTERPMPVGFGFRPTDRELVGHYLYHKLMADDPSIHETIPEIGVCKYEPMELLDRAASAASATKFDDFQCYFFSPCDYKYSNSERFNRTTSRGFWKVTCGDRRIIDRDTNNAIGIKKTLTFYERSLNKINKSKKTNWIIHEYHDVQLPLQQRTHVLCWLRKKDENRTTEKIEKVVDKERALLSENQSMNLNEYHFENMCLTIQPPSQLNEATDSMIQPPSQLNEATDSMIQPPSQLNEATDSMIQPPSQLNEATDSMIQPPSQLNEATDSMIQPLSQLNEVDDSIIQTTFLVDEENIQSTFQVDQVMNSVIHTPSEPNYAVESIFNEGEFDLALLWQLPPAPSMDEQGLFGIMATSDVHCHEA